jgi:hypothetical protein
VLTAFAPLSLVFEAENPEIIPLKWPPLALFTKLLLGSVRDI